MYRKGVHFNQHLKDKIIVILPDVLKLSCIVNHFSVQELRGLWHVVHQETEDVRRDFGGLQTSSVGKNGVVLIAKSIVDLPMAETELDKVEGL